MTIKKEKKVRPQNVVSLDGVEAGTSRLLLMVWAYTLARDLLELDQMWLCDELKKSLHNEQLISHGSLLIPKGKQDN